MGFLSKIFGGGSKKKDGAYAVVEDTLHGLIEKSGFDLSFDIKDGEKENSFMIELFGEDEELLKDKEGQLLDSFQLYMTRVLQHQLPDIRTSVEFDSNGFRQEANQELVELAEKLKGIVLSKKKSVYFRALAPKDRKIVHQYLADDDRIKSRSVGDGLYKKIKIFPAGGGRGNRNSSQQNQNTEQH